LPSFLGPEAGACDTNKVIVDNLQNEDLTLVIANCYTQANPNNIQLDTNKEEEEERILLIKY
jgi:hypothetical protein